MTELPAPEKFKPDPLASNTKAARMKLLVDYLDENSFIMRKQIKLLFKVSSHPLALPVQTHLHCKGILWGETAEGGHAEKLCEDSIPFL